jgi:hypothetical protein
MLRLNLTIWILVVIAALAAVGIFVASSQERPQQQEQTQQQPSFSDQNASRSADQSKQSQGNPWIEYEQTISSYWNKFLSLSEKWHDAITAIKIYWNKFLRFSEKWHDAITALSTTLIAAFTALLFVATWLLWFGGERHSEKQLRAYVTLLSGGIQVVNITHGGQGFRINIELKNSGQTPGYDFTTWIKPPVILDKDALPFDQPRPMNERTGMSIIGPGASTWINWTLLASPQDIADVLAETKKIFVWGGADYRDIFGYRRFFVFRDVNAPFTQGIAPGASTPLRPHKAGYNAN